MFVLQICIGVLTAVGLALVLADIYHLPTLKARKATNNLGKKGDKKVSIVEIYLKDFSTFLSKKIKLNEYKRAQLEVDLKTAGMETSPEAYVADAITKALVIALFALPVFFLFKILSMVVLFISVIVYFKEYQAVSVKIKSRRQKIEYELPRFVSAIEKTMQHNRSIVYILESYKDTAGAELKTELEITIADMRSGNVEVALTRLENRIGSTMMSDITRGLAALERGDNNVVYWGQLVIKFSDYQRQILKQQANAVPRKVRKLSMALMFCFILIYVTVIGQVLLTSLTELF
jgi:pilus assembly protein TadC